MCFAHCRSINAVTWYANSCNDAPRLSELTLTHSVTVTDWQLDPGNGSIHKLLLYYRPHNMGLRLQHKPFFLTDILAPLCTISNFNYELIRGTFRLPCCCMGGSVSGIPHCDRHLADSLCSAHSLLGHWVTTKIWHIVGIMVPDIHAKFHNQPFIIRRAIWRHVFGQTNVNQ